MDLSEFCKSISYMVISNIDNPVTGHPDKWLAKLYTPEFIENLIGNTISSNSTYYRGRVDSAMFDIYASKTVGKAIAMSITYEYWVLILQRSIIKYILSNTKKITWLYGSSPSKSLNEDRSQAASSLSEKFGGSWYLTNGFHSTPGDNSLGSILRHTSPHKLQRLVIGWIDTEQKKCFDLNFEPPNLYWNINHSQPLPHVHHNSWFFQLPNFKRKHSFLNWSKAPF
jgi:hypothetical protein